MLVSVTFVILFYVNNTRDSFFISFYAIHKGCTVNNLMFNLQTYRLKVDLVQDVTSIVLVVLFCILDSIDIVIEYTICGFCVPKLILKFLNDSLLYDKEKY